MIEDRQMMEEEQRPFESSPNYAQEQGVPVYKDVDVEDGDDEDQVTDQRSSPYNVTWYSVSIDVEGLTRRFGTQITKPDYQRQFVWNRNQASRLIESILMGLPIPGIFLYRENEAKSYIIDGFQRLTTLHSFKNGYWPVAKSGEMLSQETLNSDEKTEFRLVGIAEDNHYLFNKTYDELDEQHKQRLDNAFLNVMYIEQKRPEDNQDSAFHIFERLNSGGTPLQSQEMLNALYGGSLRDHLYELTRNPLWQEMFGKPHRRAKDQELILRFLSLLNRESDYKRPMKLFLRDFMVEYRNADRGKLAEFTDQFTKALERINEALGPKAFKPSRVFVASYFDAFMVAVAKNKTADSEHIKKAYDALRKDEQFDYFTRSATTDDNSVKGRIRMVEEAINGGL